MQKDKQSFSEKVSYWLKVVSLGMILGLGLQFAQAWTAPTQAPPAGNVAGPLTTGPIGQIKQGNLMLNTAGLANGLLVDKGNVGIGTINPNRKLHVVFDNPSTDGTNGQLVVENTANSVNGVAAMNVRVNNPGASGGIQFSVGNWQGSPNRGFFGYDHGGQEFEFWTLQGGWSPKVFIGQTGRITTNDDVNATAFYYTSDRRLKEAIETLDGALDKVLQLEGVSFQWKNGGRKDIGVIAQDIERVYPELVKIDPLTGFKSVEYGNLIAPLIEAIKEQQEKIESLEVRVRSLEEK
jgi:hypothetical protein